MKIEPLPRALVLGRNEGAPYHPLAAIEDELRTVFEPRFVVKVTERPEALLSLGLGGTDLVVGIDDRWDESLDPRYADALESWLRMGGRLLLVHNGICWARESRWMRLVGGRFIGHAEAKDLTFIRSRDGARFDLFEEPYRFSMPWFSIKRVWATYQDGGRRWPAFWSRRVGRGTIAYALPGHGVEAFRHPVYRDWLREMALPSSVPPIRHQ